MGEEKLRSIKVGLTGGIATGKTSVMNKFDSSIVYIIDTDIVSRDVVAKGTKGLAILKKEFSDCIVSDELDRRKLREVVFADKNKLEKLNSIMLPLIREEVEKRCKNVKKPIILIVAPILFEAEFDKIMDYIICTHCSKETQLQRLMHRDNITKELALSMINSQMDNTIKVGLSNFVIDTEKGESFLKEQVDRITSAILTDN